MSHVEAAIGCTIAPCGPGERGAATSRQRSFPPGGRAQRAHPPAPATLAPAAVRDRRTQPPQALARVALQRYPCRGGPIGAQQACVVAQPPPRTPRAWGRRASQPICAFRGRPFAPRAPGRGGRGGFSARSFAVICLICSVPFSTCSRMSASFSARRSSCRSHIVFMYLPSTRAGGLGGCSAQRPATCTISPRGLAAAFY